MEDQKLLRKINLRTRFTQFLVWIALIFTAAGIAAGYKNWLRIHDKAKASLAGIAEIRKEIPAFAKKEQMSLLLGDMNIQVNKHVEHLDGAMKELRQIQDSTQHIAETVYTQVETLTLQQEKIRVNQQAPIVQDWSLSEVHFLLQTAVQVFNLKQDKEGALAALAMADELLVKRGSLELLPLRKQISQDFALVTQSALPDVEALSNKIDLLQEQLEPEKTTKKNKIEIVADKAPDSVDEVLSNNSGQLTEQQSLINRVKKTINEAVVVRKFDKPLQDEMDNETKNSLYQLLSLRLETLRIMLLQGHNKNYHKQIQRIQTLLKNYYPEEKYSQLQKQLDKLNSVNLAPDMPDITKSLRLLESIMPVVIKGE